VRIYCIGRTEVKVEIKPLEATLILNKIPSIGRIVGILDYTREKRVLPTPAFITLDGIFKMKLVTYKFNNYDTSRIKQEK
jgi:hypothetical protein